MAIPYLAAAGDGCADCSYGMMLYAAPALAGTVAMGLGVRHLVRADACEAGQRTFTSMP